MHACANASRSSSTFVCPRRRNSRFEIDLIEREREREGRAHFERKTADRTLADRSISRISSCGSWGRDDDVRQQWRADLSRGPALVSRFLGGSDDNLEANGERRREIKLAPRRNTHTHKLVSLP